LSPFTKIAIVFHVVLSLMLAAGLIVFVNRTENFKVTDAAQKAEISRTRAEVESAKEDDAAQQKFAELARRDRDAAIADGQKALEPVQKQLDQANNDSASLKSQMAIMQLSGTNLTNALNTSEAERKALADSLDGTRKDNNDLTVKYSQSQLAISDLTNKLEVSQRLLTNSTETVAEQKSALESAQAQIKDFGGRVAGTGETGLEGGAPPIDAVVRTTQPINGIPYATISVGTDAQVKKGMKFSVIDRDKGDFLGELTIESVNEKDSTGKLEGPKISEVHSGTEVKTQL
jgi:hypothetical protein